MALLNTNLLLERVALGRINGATPLYLNGVNGASTTTYETLWDESNVYAFRSTATAQTISSASANDAAAGTGARTVRVTGITDTSFTESTEVVTMNGTTGVSLANNYVSINKLEVVTAGSTGVNAGIIYVGTGSITAGKPATVEGLMAASVGMSTSFLYTVPANKTLMMLDLCVATRAATAGGNSMAIETIVNLSGVKTRKFLIPDTAATGGTPFFKFSIPLVFEEKTQINGLVISGAGTGPVTALATCILLDNTQDFLTQ